ncbi:TetR family transcriptional regulator [Fontibacillus phaseoli]|uniref:TetR family transcriptional regulator n=1 Tax=Fontibacillus phaseoli TaxID=1416533 RepID=A0A369AUT6_9BACL|nr:TetR/AcrR family transcriptional regulator [Fontibacillus phaseoli]RCX12813.1 TetR family transcriptional regulator [Fontibacillus phaseoli]
MSPRAGIDSGSVLHAAIDIADKQGAEAITISSVAQHLGIRPPSLYNHVSGLGELRKMVAVHALHQLHDTIAAAAKGKQGEAAITSFADAYITFAHEHPGLYEVVQLAPDPQDREIAEVSGEIVNLIVELLGEYDLTEEEALHTVRGLRSLVHGFASLERQSGFGLPLDVKTSMDFNLKLFLAGLSQRTG